MCTLSTVGLSKSRITSLGNFSVLRQEFRNLCDKKVEIILLNNFINSPTLDNDFEKSSLSITCLTSGTFLGLFFL